jgi:hypothetical protein
MACERAWTSPVDGSSRTVESPVTPTRLSSASFWRLQNNAGGQQEISRVTIVAIGTPVDPTAPRIDPYVQGCIRLLPWILGLKAHVEMRMQDFRTRNPSIDQRPETVPRSFDLAGSAAIAHDTSARSPEPESCSDYCRGESFCESRGETCTSGSTRGEAIMPRASFLCYSSATHGDQRDGPGLGRFLLLRDTTEMFKDAYPGSDSPASDVVPRDTENCEEPS